MAETRMCPHIEREDGRCACRLSLEGLREAYEFCAGAYERCAVYHEIRIETTARATVSQQRRSA